MCQGTNWSIFTIYIPLYCNMQGKPKDCFRGVSLGTPKDCFRGVSLGRLMYNLFCLFLSRTLFWLHPFLLAYQCKPTSWFINKTLLNKIYKCVLFELFNKLFCYWKIKDNFFPSGWVLQLLSQRRLSFRFSTLYSPLSCISMTFFSWNVYNTA